jgi:hypothetical protein
MNPDPLYVPEPEYREPDRPRYRLLTWSLLLAIIAVAVVAFLIANRTVS